MRGDRVVAENRRARHDFSIEESVEAGLVLTGTEIKSLREGRVNLRESHGFIQHGEAWLYGMHIAPYEQGGLFNHDPMRPRKLLLHQRQIDELYAKVRQQGYTLVPLRVYIRDGRAKVELALAKGKHEYDKRRALAEREAKRRMQRAEKSFGR